MIGVKVFGLDLFQSRICDTGLEVLRNDIKFLGISNIL